MILSSRRDIADLPLREILELTPERFAKIFRGTAIKRVKIVGLLRNACVVAGNSGDAALVGPLLGLCLHESPIVRAHAVWATGRLGAVGLLSDARALERDPIVIAEYDTLMGRAAPRGTT